MIAARYGNTPETGVAVVPGIPHARGMYGTDAPPPGSQAPLPGSEAALIGLAALAVVFIPFLWPLVEHFSARVVT